ncbi:MAG: hypothetical protein QX198_05915 [Methylococcaceae bacterium]
MNKKLITLLVSVCIILCLLIACEWLFASYSQHSLLTSISSEKRQDYKADELPTIELTKQTEDSYVDLVARPLFIKGRRAVGEPSPESEQAAAKSENFDWQLTGVYGSNKKVSALFSRAKTKVAKDNTRKLKVGDDLDGWQLTEINKDKVMLKQGSNDKELLLRKPKLKTLPRTNGAEPAVPIPAAIPEPAANTNEDTNEDTTEGNQ